MDKDARSWWGKWRAVEIEGAVELFVGGKSRIDVQWVKEIQGHYRLNDETAQYMKGGIHVGAGKAGNEVFL